MATNKKSKKPEAAKLGKTPIAGSPVTIGGGGGLVPAPAYIEFDKDEWDYAPGKLTLKDPTKRIKIVEAEHIFGRTRLRDIGITEIEIYFDN